MPFHGVLPERRYLFRPEPKRDIGVSDAEAWRLNPAHRHLYDKLQLALGQGVTAAPCGVPPAALGLGSEAQVFVKPIINLEGMALQAQVCPAGAVPVRPGHFWCQYLQGRHTSTDCLVRDGEVLWYAHTAASAAKDRHRPLFWHVGVALPQLEPAIAELIARLLRRYTGICNLEMIGGVAIELHLRGSNGFFDFYGPDFLPAWVRLVDRGDWDGILPPEEGWVFSRFGAGPVPDDAQKRVRGLGVRLVPDTSCSDRNAVLYAPSREAGEHALSALGQGADGRPAGWPEA